MMLRDTSTPVLVLKCEHYGSLGIARSLGRLGVKVFGVDEHPNAPMFHSRYCAGSFVWGLDNAPDHETIDRLFQIAARIGGKPILLPTSDETALFVARNQGILTERFRFPRTPLDIMEQFCRKKDMALLAASIGIPTAETTVPRSLNDVRTKAGQLRYPIMLKANDGAALEKRVGAKMLIVRSAKELVDTYASWEDASHPNLMLQEYIPGGEDSVWMFNGYFDSQSECLAGFTGKKIRQNPVYTGMTSLGVCLYNSTVIELTLRLAKAVGYSGILDIGFRYDDRDGTYKVLDVNPRVGATFRLFVDDEGCDVVRSMYCDMTGQAVHAGRGRDRRKWVVEDKDLKSSGQYYRDGVLSIAEWLRSFRGVEEAAYFSINDPKPFVHLVTHHCRKAFGKLIHAVRSQIHQSGSEPSDKPRTSALTSVSRQAGLIVSGILFYVHVVLA